LAGIDRKGPGNLSQDSIVSSGSAKVARDSKKTIAKQRTEARRFKLDNTMLLEDADIGHDVDVPEVVSWSGDLAMGGDDSNGRNAGGGGAVLEDSSEAGTLRANSGGSISSGLFSSSGTLSSKVGSGTIFGKGSSLLFPTGVDASKGADDTKNSSAVRRQKVNLVLDQCESIRWPYRKNLILTKLGLQGSDIPIKDLYGTSLGENLHKLSLSGNRIASIPPKLVTCLPLLKTLDLSQNQLHKLPERWNLPQLQRLNLSHNLLVDFPEEVRLKHYVVICIVKVSQVYSAFDSLVIRSKGNAGRDSGAHGIEHVWKQSSCDRCSEQP
jgi:Leucine rich repeat